MGTVPLDPRTVIGGFYIGRRSPSRRSTRTSSRRSTRTSSRATSGITKPKIPEPDIPETDEYQSMLQGIVEKYQPGGPFEEAGLEQLKRKRTKGVAQRTQNIVGRGLAGTTQAGLVGTKFEEEVGMPYKLGLEEQRTAGLTGALQAKTEMQSKLAALQQQRDIAQQKIEQQYDELFAEQGGGSIGTIVTDMTPGLGGWITGE